MNPTTVLIEIDEGVAHIVLNRPEKRNAMSRAFWAELPQVVRQIDDQSLARVIVISSTGSYFSSGIDTSMFGTAGIGSDPLAARLARYEDIKTLQQTFTALENCRVPVIAAIQGGCLGGGVDLVSACCIRLAAADAFFSVFEINVGLPPDTGSIPRLLRLLPEGIVRELAYSGRKMDAAEAQQRGFVNQVYADHAELLDEAMKLARQIAAKAPIAVHAAKHLITYGRDHSTEDTLTQVALWVGGIVPSEQILEAARANKEKRPALFADLPRRDG